MVALPHSVGHVPISVMGIYIAHEALFLSAVGTVNLLLTLTGQLSSL